jgi:hypothetical protein
MLIALVLLLLLLEQVVEADFLLRIQNGSKLFPCLLQFLANLGSDWLHYFPAVFLAVTDDFVGLFALIRSEIQVAFGAPQEFDSYATSGDRLNSINLRMLRVRWRLDGIFYQ